ncbi:MAG: aldolase/citrate lyase family protein [Caldilineaceae bacterium]
MYGLICPMVNSKEEAEAFVGACRYPPKGYRSFGPRRATVYAGEDYPEYANETVVTMAMIETADAVKNLEDILSVGELDAIYVGPADLSLSLTNQRSFDYTDPELMAVLDHILVTAQKFGTLRAFTPARPPLPTNDREGLPIRRHPKRDGLHGQRGQTGAQRGRPHRCAGAESPGRAVRIAPG